MITIQRYAELGTFTTSWLNAHYHFSFASYHNPARMGTGPLRVINDDIVAVGGGFDFHPHRDMEIITYVRQGAISHRDNLGNQGKTAAGNVQVMSAGTGIVHAEHNEEDEATRLYQIWIQPNARGVEPRWENRAFPKHAGGGLTLLVSGLPEHQESGAMFIHGDAAVYGGVLKAGATERLPLTGAAYVLASEGDLRVNGELLRRGDGAEVRNAGEVTVEAVTQAEAVVILLPTA